MHNWKYLSQKNLVWIKLKAQIKFIFILFFCFLIAGCGRSTSKSTSNPFQTISPQSTIALTTTISPSHPTPPIPSESPTPSIRLVWLPAYLPEKIRITFTLPAGYNLAVTPEEADITLELSGQNAQPTIQWIYSLVAPFPTITDGVTLEELRSTWDGIPVSPFNDDPLLMDENTLNVLTALWGPPAAKSVQVLLADELLDYAWSNIPSWAIIPFENLNPRWKVLTIDGQSPVRKDFDPTRYRLTVNFSLAGDINMQPEVFNLPTTNRSASKLTTVAMTGVTAMVRATAYTMELKGITYPAEDIGPILSEADITHISNEIPFSPDCPFPTPQMDALVFCSNPSYIDLLKAVGTDIVELTGDHFMDYGPEATLYTLQMYDDLGWKYFGGGANANEARQPVLLENNGNKLAFMGCNVGCVVKNEIPCDAIATDSHPGAAQCDFNWISDQISTLRRDGYQVIFTFQHREYYTYNTEPILSNDFGQVASAGASIVSGSQAHQPHGFAFDNSAFIHYGLGNLFFDQYHFCADYACDNAFIDRHVFYDGQYISTELITIRFVDAARSRLMTPEERANFLEIIFKASGW
jgi:hypothetical protein